MSPRLRWVLAIVTLLVANVLAMVLLAATAGTHPPEILPGYGEELKK
jgi:hypothetical protein